MKKERLIWFTSHKKKGVKSVMNYKIIGATINEINTVAELIEKYGSDMTLEELYFKLKKDHDEYFSEDY